MTWKISYTEKVWTLNKAPFKVHNSKLLLNICGTEAQWRDTGVLRTRISTISTVFTIGCWIFSEPVGDGSLWCLRRLIRPVSLGDFPRENVTGERPPTKQAFPHIIYHCFTHYFKLFNTPAWFGWRLFEWCLESKASKWGGEVEDAKPPFQLRVVGIEKEVWIKSRVFSFVSTSRFPFPLKFSYSSQRKKYIARISTPYGFSFPFRRGY